MSDIRPDSDLFPIDKGLCGRQDGYMDFTATASKQELAERIEELCALSSRLYAAGDHESEAEVEAEIDRLVAAYESL